MAEEISKDMGKPIQYILPGLLQFFLTKRKENMPTMLILVMIMLHYFPGFKKTPRISSWVKMITGKEPNSFAKFVMTNRGNVQWQTLLI